MIFTKHLVYLAALFALLPVIARLAANRAGRIAGQAPVPIDLAFLIQTVGLGILFALASQGGWELLVQFNVDPQIARYVSLGIVGLLYGAFIGLQDYVYGGWAVFLGLAGGLLTAFLYSVLPFGFATQALLGLTMTALPILAIEIPGAPISRIIRAGQALLPVRGYIR